MAAAAAAAGSGKDSPAAWMPRGRLAHGLGQGGEKRGGASGELETRNWRAATPSEAATALGWAEELCTWLSIGEADENKPCSHLSPLGNILECTIPSVFHRAAAHL